MNHEHHGHDHHVHHEQHETTGENYFRLAFAATLHCLIGCGLGEVAGIIIGTAIGLANVPSMILALALGAIFGLALGMRPLLIASYGFRRALKQTLIAEGLSIAVM